MDILSAQVSELLTTYLGRVPTSAELANGLAAGLTLSTVHNELNVGQSTFSISPGDDIQGSLDKLSANGGGILYLGPGTYFTSSNLLLTSDIRIQGVGSGGSVIDFGGGAFQIQVIGTAMSLIDSVFLEGFTVTNSSVELIKVSYTNNFGGNDILCSNGLSGISIDNSTIFNWDINTVDSCASGIVMDTVDGFTIQNAFVNNITTSGAYLCDTVTNGVLINSSLDTVVGVGFSFTNSGNVGVDQVSVANVTGIGFVLDSINDSFSIANTLIASSSGDGLKLLNSSSDVQVISTQFSANGGYGVNIADSGCTDNLFVANTFLTNGSGAINNLGTGTLIRSNIGATDSP